MGCRSLILSNVRLISSPVSGSCCGQLLCIATVTKMDSPPAAHFMFLIQYCGCCLLRNIVFKTKGWTMLDHFHKLLYSSVSDHVHILLYGGFFLLLKTCSPMAWIYVAPFKSGLLTFVLEWVRSSLTVRSLRQWNYMCETLKMDKVPISPGKRVYSHTRGSVGRCFELNANSCMLTCSNDNADAKKL